MENQYTDLVTICIPVYKRSAYFKEALECSIEQTIKCKIIVVENPSDENNFEYKCAEYGAEYYRNEENIGMYQNWNRCIELCQTEWCTILHDDDLLSEDFIEMFLKFIEENNGAYDFTAYACRCLIDADRKILKKRYLLQEKTTSSFSTIERKHFLTSNLSPFPGVVFRKSIAQSIGGFRTDEYPCADAYFWYRLYLKGKIAILNLNQALYFMNQNQASSKVAQQIVDVIYHHRINIAKTLYERLIVKESIISLSKHYTNHFKFNVPLKLPFILIFYRIEYFLINLTYNFKKFKWIVLS